MIEKPGTAFELENRLQRRFSSYGYARNIVRRTLGRLRTSGLVIDRPPACRAGGTGREGMVWEATATGVERSRAWVGEEVGAPLARDELHAKIALCSEDDLPRLLGVVQEAERDCEERLATLNTHERPGTARSSADTWAVEMGTIASDAERSWWENRRLWLSRLKGQLERANEQSNASSEEADGSGRSACRPRRPMGRSVARAR